MQPSRASVAVTLLAVDTAALASFRPAFGVLPARLSAPHAWSARVGPDGALAVLAGCALWLVGAWLGLGLLAALAGRLPGCAGRLSATLGHVLLPRVAIRLLAGSAGLGVLLAPVAAGAKPVPAATQGGDGPVAAAGAGSATPGQRPVVAAAPDGALPAPSWPTDPAPSPSTVDRGSVPAPIWPTSVPGAPTPSPGAATQSPSAGAPPSGPAQPGTPGRAQPAPTRGGSEAPTSPPPTRPTAPHSPVGPSPSAGPTGSTRPSPGSVVTAPKSGHGVTQPSPGTTGSAPGDTVTVRPGDSLWLIAARRLGPQPTAAEIAAAWPRWYAANKESIGSDPDLIRPGQVLHTPALAQPEEANP